MNFADRPQERIGSWPITSGDSLYGLTLAQLLSFTSGLTAEPLCLNAGASSFVTCVTDIATANTGNGIAPRQEFYYASTHLQVAGHQALRASAARQQKNGPIAGPFVLRRYYFSTLFSLCFLL